MYWLACQLPSRNIPQSPPTSSCFLLARKRRFGLPLSGYISAAADLKCAVNDICWGLARAQRLCVRRLGPEDLVILTMRSPSSQYNIVGFHMCFLLTYRAYKGNLRARFLRGYSLLDSQATLTYTLGNKKLEMILVLPFQAFFSSGDPRYPAFLTKSRTRGTGVYYITIYKAQGC